MFSQHLSSVSFALKAGDNITEQIRKVFYTKEECISYTINRQWAKIQIVKDVGQEVNRK